MFLVTFEKNNYLLVETFLTNFCFLLLLSTTLFYWIRFIFFSKTKFFNFGIYGLIIANFTIFLQLSLRWIESGHFPLSNLYESLLFLAWGLLFVFIILEKIINLDVLGIIISPTLLCIIGFTDFSLPEDLQKIKPLVPALQSNWLFMHVSVMIFSYAALIIGCLLSISFLLYFYYLNKLYHSLDIFCLEKNHESFFDNNKKQENLLKIKNGNGFFEKNQDFFKKDDIEQNNYNSSLTFFSTRLKLLDNLSYRLIGIGFCFLTLGILSGAIWANETWGTYWSWDPKETWALITWLIFAIYLHTRLIYGFQGVKSAWIAFSGFFILWMCYLGVNLLGEGLHSYGFLDS